jgi:hypothetical protein
MKKKTDSSGRRPSSPSSLIDCTGVQERILLQAELLTRDRELRSFSSIRDRLAAAGKDTNLVYREILAQRDKAAAKLRTMRKVPPASSKIIPPLPEVSLLNAPIAPANFVSGISGIIGGAYGFGYSGFVQAGGLTEGVNVTPGQGATGGIDTENVGAPTYVYFDGIPTAPAGAGNDPTVKYFWLHNWQVLVPFPPPTGPSWLTYRFTVGATFDVFGDGAGQVMAFVSVGETANLTGPVAITTDVGWPVNADLSQPGEAYNGSYGSISGQVEVQRTFAVGAAAVPAVAICVGVVVGLPEGAQERFVFDDYSAIGISGPPPFPGGYAGGRIAYYVQPQEVVVEA